MPTLSPRRLVSSGLVVEVNDDGGIGDDSW